MAGSAKKTKTSDRIEKEQAKLDALYAKKSEISRAYEAQMQQFEDSIKKQKELLEQLRAQDKSEKVTKIVAVSEKLGISVEDMLDAAMNGDFASLQEKIEQKAKEKTTAVSAKPAEQGMQAEQTEQKENTQKTDVSNNDVENKSTDNGTENNAENNNGVNNNTNAWHN